MDVKALLAVIIILLMLLAALAGALVAVLLTRRRTRRTGDPRAPGASGASGGPGARNDPFRDTDADALQGDPRRLDVGDLVDVRGRPYQVRGTVHFAEGGWSWTEHLLDDAQGRRRWLAIAEEPDLEMVLWTDEPAATVTPAETVEFAGRRYHRHESGRARFTTAGTTGLDPAGTVRYQDLRADDDTRLSFEAFGDADRWEVSTGEVLHRAEVRVYPTGGQ